jgi:hypothetical protein
MSPAISMINSEITFYAVTQRSLFGFDPLNT